MDNYMVWVVLVLVLTLLLVVRQNYQLIDKYRALKVAHERTLREAKSKPKQDQSALRDLHLRG